MLISSNNGQIFNGEKHAALKIHAGVDEKHPIEA